MASWRDSASQQTQDDLDGLLDACLEQAAVLLERHGEFYPFGVSIDHDGDATLHAPDSDTEFPDSQALLDTLVDGLIGRRDLIRAAGWVADVRLADEPGDAIGVTLEHADGVTMNVVQPYTQTAGGVTYADLRAGPAEPRIWA
jgi:hypothetical protein